ncbi:hypothetical protein Gbem_3682 [Citrifermentans bemidjiense Bem]|uniref:Uncharacterized protein n=1 Tax=Citrifermentans bemidjiense (strain ATCC BAA-1014 / DSM 16622 / JCM 12645 / Bem) TaxID=404380 RepID=B5EDP6_CITBB|nr:hypothetical protein [Citrifermentans bemidjiense]ACH40674.1 hypothetical protein Gbem_3682 [Citrifermentans bemidjiense Bem]
MTHTFETQSGLLFSALPIKPIEIFTSDHLDGVCVDNVVTDQSGQRFTILFSEHVNGRVYRLLLLPVAQEVQ